MVVWARQDGRLERRGPGEAIQDKLVFWQESPRVSTGGRFKRKKKMLLALFVGLATLVPHLVKP